MLNLLQEVAIMSENGGQIARLSNVMDGVDGAATFGYTIEEGEFAIEDNQKVQRYHDHTLDIRLLNDPVAEGIIDGIISAGERAYIAGYTPDGFLCFDEPVIIARNPQYDQNIVSAFSARKRTLCGYTEVSKGFYKSIYAGRNLLALYDVTRPRTNSSVLSGFVATSSYDFTFAGGVQGLERTGAAPSFHKYAHLFWPFQIPIKLTVDFESLSSDVVLRLNYEDDGMSSIGDDDKTVSSSGTETLTATPPPNTAFVSVWMTIDQNETFSFKHPRITRGSNTKFTL